jgi:hypothetical protein
MPFGKAVTLGKEQEDRRNRDACRRDYCRIDVSWPP